VLYSRKQQVYICENCQHRFQLETKLLPRRIFISYGHDEHAQLALRLKADLEARGHDVWFDLDRLKPGGDWEAYIHEGLEWVAEAPGTGRVVLLMTPHSIRRPDGYCLNEIARAVERGLPVVPVMVVWAEPPLSICRIQWLDMQECVPIQDRQERYEAKFERLAEALEQDRIEFEGAQSRLHRILEPLPFDADITQHLHRFTGRQWVFDRIGAWLADPKASRVFWITGSPGVGKTALASWLCYHSREVAAFHLCRYGHVQKSDPRRCVRSVAYQLGTQLPDYAARLNALNLESIIAESNARTLFDALIVQPLSGSLPRPDRTIVILIDALDEATQDGQNELAAFIASEFGKTPAWLRLIITSRPDPEVVHPLQAFTPYVLDASAPENEGDIREYLARELALYAPDGVVPQATIDNIVARSEGVFLYAEWIRQELALGRLSLERPGRFPQGLGGVYAQFFERQFPDVGAYERDIRPACEALSAAQEPMLLGMLAGMFGWDDYAHARFCRSLGSLFPIRDGRIQPFHRSVLDWLTEARDAGPYFVSVHEGHKRLADHGWQEFQSGGADALSRYGLAHLPTHLGKAERWQELQTVLTDLAFIEAKCAAGLSHDLIADYNAALTPGGLPAEMRGPVEEFVRFVRFQSHVLARRPALVFQQAANEPDNTAPAQAALQRLKAGHETRPWLRCLNKSERASPCLMTLVGHTRGVNACTFSPDGKQILSASSDNTLKLWDVATGKELKTLAGHTDVVRACAFSPDGRRIVSASFDKTLRLWDADAGKELAVLVGHKRAVRACAFSPDGSRIASGAEDGTLKLWDASRTTEIATLAGHEQWVNTCAFSPDGSRIVSGAWDGTLKVWDVATAAEMITLRGHTESVRACAFSLDGKRVVSGSEDQTLKLWDVATGAEVATFVGHSLCVNACQFSPDGARIVSAAGLSLLGELKLWDTVGKTEIANLPEHKYEVQACAFSPDGTKIVSGSYDNTLKIWDVSVALKSTNIPGHADRVWSCAFSPEGSLIASGSEDGTLKLWDGGSGAGIATLSGHTSWVDACRFSPDGSRIVSASEDKTLKLWDAHTGKELATLAGHAGEVRACAFSPDGGRVVSGADDLTLRLWDAASGTELAILVGHTDAIRACVFSPDGSRILSASLDWTLKLWDTEAGTQLATLAGHKFWVTACAFSPDGSQILSGSGPDDNALKLWDAVKARELATLTGHTRAVWGCAFSPDGRLIASCSSDGTLKLWDVTTRMVAGEYWTEGALYAVAWRPDGRAVAVGDSAGRVHLMTLENFTLGPLVATAWRSPKDSSYAFGCPICRTWSEVPASALGTELPCPHCGERIGLPRFTIHADWRSVAQAWSERRK